jgi:hypothetical protein
MAARYAMALATEMIGQVGPAALLSEDPPPKAPLDGRVRLNQKQVTMVARALTAIAEATRYPFVSPELPLSDILRR